MILLHAGDFGEAVGQRMRTREPDLALADLGDPAFDLGVLDGHATVLVATWRPYDRLARAVDRACFRRGVPWTIVEIAGTTLTASPRFGATPGSGCYHCLVARADAHARNGDRSRVLRRAYDAAPALGPSGHTGPMVELALASFAEARAGRRDRGEFRQVDVLTGTVLESLVIPLHDCPRCRPADVDHDPRARFTRDLVAGLKELTA